MRKIFNFRCLCKYARVASKFYLTQYSPKCHTNQNSMAKLNIFSKPLERLQTQNKTNFKSLIVESIKCVIEPKPLIFCICVI